MALDDAVPSLQSEPMKLLRVASLAALIERKVDERMAEMRNDNAVSGALTKGDHQAVCLQPRGVGPVL